MLYIIIPLTNIIYQISSYEQTLNLRCNTPVWQPLVYMVFFDNNKKIGKYSTSPLNSIHTIKKYCTFKCTVPSMAQYCK